MKLNQAVIALLLMSGCLSAQRLEFGVGLKAGLPVTDVINSTDPATQIKNLNASYIIGPTAEMRLPFGLAAEVDGLYHHAEYAVPSNLSAWEVPYMAKFRFPIPLIKPFVLAGGAYRSFTRGGGNNGFVTGLGLEVRISRLRLSAEGRYLHWNGLKGRYYDHGIAFARDQGEVLFGVTF